jgi:hypothetical protein
VDVVVISCESIVEVHVDLLVHLLVDVRPFGHGHAAVHGPELGKENPCDAERPVEADGMRAGTRLASRRIMSQIRPTSFGIVLLFVSACGGDDSVVCGAGTVERNGVCRPADGDEDSDSDTDSNGGCAGRDFDGDGQVSEACGGDDCNDGDTTVHPGADDVFGDGVDQGCDGVDGVDDDRDGHAREADDCDDESATVYTGAPDPDGDCVDQDCDGLGGPDEDGDGFASTACAGDDCDDASTEVTPAAADPAGDGEDTNCDGMDGEDLDGDGYVSIPSGGDDCDDGDAATYPGAIDLFGDGVDQDCAGGDGVDADGDGHASVPSGGDDCDDADAAIHPGVVEDEDWAIETVDDEGDTGWFAQIALDGDDVHIGYWDATSHDLRYAYDALGVWVLDSVVSSFDYSTSSFTLADGFAHFTYSSNYSEGLHHASNDPFAWTVDEVRDARAGGNSFVVSEGGLLHVVYDAGPSEPYSLEYASGTPGAWTTEVVSTGCSTLTYTCSGRLTVVDGVPHVTWVEPDMVYYAFRDAGGWTIEPIEPVVDGDNPSARPSIAVDGGVVRVVWYDYYATGDLKYGKRDADGEWTVETIDTSVNGFQDSLVVEDGVAYVAYVTGIGGQVNYATNIRGAWEIETVEDGGDAGYAGYASLALGADTVHVAYRLGAADGDLMYAHRSRPDGTDSDCDGRD